VDEYLGPRLFEQLGNLGCYSQAVFRGEGGLDCNNFEYFHDKAFNT